jgi:hypothetical protein
VTKTALSAIDQTPDQLVGFLNYSLLLQQLAVFTGSQVTVLNGTAGVAYNATSFPMPPFTQFATSGRLDGNSKPADLSFVFAANNLVSQTYLDEVDAYLNQLFVNQTQGDTKQLAAAAAPANILLSQQIFLEYFAGLIRSGVHLLLQTIEDANQDSQNLDQLICAPVTSLRWPDRCQASSAEAHACPTRPGSRFRAPPSASRPTRSTPSCGSNSPWASSARSRTARTA